MEELELDYQMAIKGREFWLNLKNTYAIDEFCCLILCPLEDKLLNKVAMENLTEYLVRKYIKRSIVVSVYFNLKSFYPYPEDTKVLFEHINQEEMECILKYYRLTQFTRNIVVVSLEQPFGNGSIIGKKNITLTDYIKDAIYV